MYKKLIARTAKLSTESRKGHRGKGVAITYEHIPQDVDERNHGSIYAVINVNAPHSDAEQIAELILDAFHGEYYQDLTRDPLISFEAALTRVNEELADATNQGKISWLNNLNAILGILSNHEFHITKAGKTEAYLYRGEKSSHVSNDLGGDTVNPLRTFINIASGELNEGDRVAIVTPGVFFSLSKDELQKYSTEFQPKVAIGHLASLLEGGTGESSPNAILILEAISPEAASNETIEDKSDDLWLSEPKKPVKEALDASAPFFKRALIIISAAWAGIMIFTSEKIIPFVKNIPTLIGNLIDSFNKNKSPKSPKEKIFVDTDEAISLKNDESKIGDLAIDESEEIVAEITPKVTANEIYIKESIPSNKPKWLKLEKFNFSKAQGAGSQAKKLFKRLFVKRGYALAAAVVVVILLIGGVYLTWQSRENTANEKLANTSFAQAESKYNDGQKAITSGDNKQAAENLREAQKIAESLTKNKFVDKDASALLVKINAGLDQAEGIVRANPDMLADVQKIVGKTPLGPYLINESLYLINKDNGNIASVSATSGEVATAIDSPTIEGKILAATPVTRRSVLAFITDKGNIYEFDTKELEMNKQDVAGEIEKPISMTSYITNIYTLDSTNGKIYKRLKTSTGYGRRTDYITDNTNVSNNIGIATDSSIYTMGSDGSITKYLAGKKQNYNITNLPFKIDKPNTLFASEGIKNLYITDSGRNSIIVFDDTGKFVSQQVSEKFDNLNGLFVTENTGYVSANGLIYKLAL